MLRGRDTGLVNPLYTGDSYTRTLTNSEDPDEMPQNARRTNHTITSACISTVCMGNPLENKW